MNTSDVIALAHKHLGKGYKPSSAVLCLDDALTLRERGDLHAAKKRALDSLRYSVGVFHADYKRAAK